jgi:hypothetical protein
MTDNIWLYQFINRLNTDESTFEKFLAAVRGGQNSVTHNVVSQALMLDDGWILTIESALYSVEQIVRNPRKFIAENELIVDVEKARRTNAKTVRHLSSHSQYIQNIDEKGNVMPKKLLTAELEEDVAIYENRFICALVNRLILFVEQRYKDLNGKLDVFDQKNVGLVSNFTFGESKFKCDIKLTVEQPPEDRAKLEKNKDLFERVELIRRRLKVLQTTDFIKKLSAQKAVRPPIQKTNLLTKNVDYNNCYKLWLYISSYTYLGYSIEIKDKNLPVDGDYFDDLAVISTLSLQSLINNNIINKDRYESVAFNVPKTCDYNVVTNLSYKPTFDSNKAQVGAESINEYYFRKMKDELIKLSTPSDIVIDKTINMPFVKFCRSVARINDELVNDLVEDSLPEEVDVIERTAYEKRRMQIKRQQELVKRRKLVTKLKWEELERAQRIEERALAKLEKLIEDDKQKSKGAVNKKVKKTKLIVRTKTDKGDIDV